MAPTSPSLGSHQPQPHSSTLRSLSSLTQKVQLPENPPFTSKGTPCPTEQMAIEPSSPIHRQDVDRAPECLPGEDTAFCRVCFIPTPRGRKRGHAVTEPRAPISLCLRLSHGVPFTIKNPTVAAESTWQKSVLNMGTKKAWIQGEELADAGCQGHGRETHQPSLLWIEGRTQDFQLGKSRADWDKLVTPGGRRDWQSNFSW